MYVPPAIIEDTTGTATGAEAVYRFAEEMPVAQFECWGDIPRPAQCVPKIVASWDRRRPGSLRNLKLSWFGHRSTDCVNPDTFLRPPASHVIDAFKTGTLNTKRDDEQGDSDQSLANDLAESLPELPQRILINNEAATGQWAWRQLPKLTDPVPGWASSPEDHVAKVQAANDRNTEIVTAVLMDDRCRAQLAPSLQSIPKDPAAIIAAFSGNQFGSALHEARQADWFARWNLIRLRSLRATLKRSGLLEGNASVYISFTGAWRRCVCDANGHMVVPDKMPINCCANWQWYGGDSRSLAMAASMADAPGAMHTFHADRDAAEVGRYLASAAPNGAFLYTERGPGGLNHLTEMLAQRAEG